MNAYLFYPLDPLVFGTGKPFSAVPGSRVDSAPLPPPSTLAGLIRTTAGRDTDGRFDASQLDALLAHDVLGPLLAWTGPKAGLAAPAPADALRLSIDAPATQNPEDAQHELRRLVPLALGPDDRVSEPGLAPVGQVRPSKRKPARGAPPYWTLDALVDWLATDRPPGLTERIPAATGVRAPREEPRIHVRIGPDGTADDGALFSTTGRRFEGTVDGARCSLALYGETTAPLPSSFHATLGGEARLSHVERTPSLLPKIPDSVVRSARGGFLRLYLLTPAPLGGSAFEPNWGRVVAQASGRPEVISGWAYVAPTSDRSDYRAAADADGRRGGCPKPTRRLVPAGSVLFVSLDGTPDEREALARRLWVSSIASDQDARDGFGRVLLGTWDGALHALQLQE